MTDSKACTPREKFYKEIKEMLERINSIYVEGCVQYYESTKKNEWTDLWEMFDNSSLFDDEILFKKKMIFLESGVTKLVERYRNIKNYADRMNQKIPDIVEQLKKDRLLPQDKKDV